jgi:hypothetical protein
MGYDPKEADEDVLQKKNKKTSTVERLIYRIFLEPLDRFHRLSII